jgi:hypothetical protein
VGAVPTADGPPGRLFYLVDSLAGTRFLVDSGAAFSVLPHKSAEPASGPALRGAELIGWITWFGLCWVSGRPLKSWRGCRRRKLFLERR